MSIAASIQCEPGMTFKSGKTYTHSVGLSCCFRQWRAESHCHFLHGYSIKVDLSFKGKELDERNWLVDFGGLKSFKGWLEDTFDHTTIVAEDDPHIETFRSLHKQGLIQLRELPSVGCEAMAYAIYQYLDMWMQSNGYYPRIEIDEVRVSEHEANWASYGKDSR